MKERGVGMKHNLFRSVDLFAGIGGIRLAFEAYGVECAFASEWDKYACDMYENHFGERPAGDITKIHEQDIPNHDILLAGFPCQAFSIMGDKRGFAESRGTLFFDIARIVNVKRPLCVFLENVKNFKSHDNGKTFQVVKNTLDELGYDVNTKVLNALDFGLPQKRERIIIVAFRKELNTTFTYPNKSIIKDRKLEDILFPRNKVASKYFVSPYILKKRHLKCSTKLKLSIWHENKSKDVTASSFSCALRAGASHSYLLVNGERRLTPRECMRLQGFPEDYEIVISDTQMKKVTGNTVPIPMIRAVAKEVVKTLKKSLVASKRNKVTNEIFTGQRQP
ncbi:MAG: DNA (cytosine-5-)-methyltransferase [Halobacteriovoraceae bacterium]|nr:DNA (cytosine-5-)-methyltransferase [Halobacteriovoraceae bacterium]